MIFILPPHAVILDTAHSGCTHCSPYAPLPPVVAHTCSDPLDIDRLVLFVDRLTRTISLLNLPPNLRILVSIDLRSSQLSC